MRGDAVKDLNVCSDWKKGMKWVIEQRRRWNNEV